MNRGEGHRARRIFLLGMPLGWVEYFLNRERHQSCRIFVYCIKDREDGDMRVVGCTNPRRFIGRSSVAKNATPRASLLHAFIH